MVQAVGAGYDPYARSMYYTFGANATAKSSQAVAPVKPVTPIEPLLGQADRLKRVEANNNIRDEKVISKYADASQASYDVTNPYEAARMTTEGATLSGMNFDMFA